MTCERASSGVLDLYFYDELPPVEREATEAHLAACGHCRQAMEDLEVISRALASRPAITSPPGGDWTGFMARLDAAIDVEARAQPSKVVAFPLPAPRSGAAGRAMAIAATLALATTSLIYFAARPQPGVPMSTTAQPGATPQLTSSASAPETSTPTAGSDLEQAARAGFTQLSEQHFGRSKLVILGMATKDAARASGADWEYERQLASSLLSDTRLYRAAAEENGMAPLASVLADLELVLLQTSMAQTPSRDDLEQIQRLIRKRDLVTKMNVVGTTGL